MSREVIGTCRTANAQAFAQHNLLDLFAANQQQNRNNQQQYQGVYDPRIGSPMSQGGLVYVPPQSKPGLFLEKKEKKMSTSYVREYFVKHREILMGLAIFILLDHYIFEGAFREKIKRIVHGILDRTENKLLAVESKS